MTTRVIMPPPRAQTADDIWNEAIEAAAKIVDQANRDGPYNAIMTAPQIRALKR